MSDEKKPLPLRTPIAKREELNARLAKAQRPAPPRPAIPPPSKPGVVAAEILAAKHHDAALERGDEAVEARRLQSEADHTAASTTAAIIVHNQKIEAAQADLAIGVCLLAREHGIEHLLPSSLQASVPPPAKWAAKPPRRAFKRLSRENAVAAVAIVLVDLFRDELVALARALIHLL